jgi:hypothetical protein
MSTTKLGPRLLTTARNPWAMVISALGGGILWAMEIPTSLAATTATVMFGTAVVVGALSGSRPTQLASRCRGGRQRELMRQFDEHVRAVRALDASGQPDVVRSRAAQALAAADSVRPSVLQLGVATDTVDKAIRAAQAVRGQGPHALSSIGAAVRRLRKRRDLLLDRLACAVDEIAAVYAGLLELSATASTFGVGIDDSEIGAVNDAVMLLQTTFAELETQAADLARDTALW